MLLLEDENPCEDLSLRAGKEVIKTRVRTCALARERGDRLLSQNPWRFCYYWQIEFSIYKDFGLYLSSSGDTSFINEGGFLYK